MGVLFGTDGIRGKANQHPMTADLALKVGRAAAKVLAAPQAAGGAVIIGQDSRHSGDMLAQAAAAGVLSAGLDACRAGVLPTPAVARLVVETGAPFGIMISASHNPFDDNGIKIFQARGFKLDDTEEDRIEALVLGEDPDSRSAFVAPGRMQALGDADQRYRRFLTSLVNPEGFKKLTVVLDCANGAASAVAPEVFAAAGARVTAIANHPDGRNINHRCGSQHPEALRQAVLEAGADAGLAFDGDADRLLAIDETGKALTGDQLIAIFAWHRMRQNRLCPRRVVTTVMSNMGLKTALEEMNIAHEISAVGDRRVMEKMRATGATLGGEDSGHIIFLDAHTTGDGLLSGLRLLEVMAESGRPLSALADVMTVFPQVLLGVAVRDKPPIGDLQAVAREIAQVEAELAGKGRVLVRYSGTEPLCRVMVEGPSLQQTEALCGRIAAVVKEAIGV